LGDLSDIHSLDNAETDLGASRERTVTTTMIVMMIAIKNM
jgi:hypothetical protein